MLTLSSFTQDSIKKFFSITGTHSDGSEYQGVKGEHLGIFSRCVIFRTTEETPRAISIPEEELSGFQIVPWVEPEATKATPAEA